MVSRKHHRTTVEARPCEPPLPDPLAFFLTWTTYGTWLPGDERGWVKQGAGFQRPDPERKFQAELCMTEEACILAPDQRRVVEETIAEHCRIRGWKLHAVNCRTMHVHVVVTADRDPEVVRDQFKAWCTRKLKALQQSHSSFKQRLRRKWWTERGSERYLNDEESLEAAIHYVLEAQ